MATVHPRTCGGNPIVTTNCLRSGSIPAHAGETTATPWSASSTPVHPRTCGGNPTELRFTVEAPGPSPHMRGKLHTSSLWGLYCRSIPAHAGETQRVEENRAREMVHPRTCGGNGVTAGSGLGLPGPSPHMRGKPAPAALNCAPVGSIPAHAGETRVTGSVSTVMRVHPRTCGGNAERLEWIASTAGPSPHMRGKPKWDARPTHIYRSIPAHAGETFFNLKREYDLQVHPRTCGGNARCDPEKIEPQGPSPHMRGKLGSSRR